MGTLSLYLHAKRSLFSFFVCGSGGGVFLPIGIPMGQFHCTLLYPVYRRGCNFEIEREREYVIMTFDLF